MESFIQKYKQELSSFAKDNDFESILAYLEDLINYADVRADFGIIRYKIPLTKAEWKSFSDHPERKPYESKVKDIPEYYADFFEYAINIISDTRKLVDGVDNRDQKLKLEKRLASLISVSIAWYGYREELKLIDSFWGRTQDERDEGYVKPTKKQLEVLNSVVEQYSYFTNTDYGKNKKKVYELSNGGRIGTLADVLVATKKDKETFDLIVEILALYRSSVDFSSIRLRLAWEMWKKLRVDAGVKYDYYLRINGYPESDQVIEKMTQLLENKEFNTELESHLQAEYPDIAKVYKKEGFLRYTDYLHQKSIKHEYPEELRSEEEARQMVEDAESRVFKYLPLAEARNPRTKIFNPVKDGANTRAFNSSVRNREGELINVICMTPRSSDPQRYLKTFAHECGHAIHRVILYKAEEKGLIKENAANQVPGGVMEEFSQLLEDQFNVDETHSNNKERKTKLSKKFMYNFENGVTVRHQAPYGIMQVLAHKEFDEIIDTGHTGYLDQELLEEIRYKLDYEFKRLYETGFAIKRNVVRGSSFVRNDSLDDRIVYMKRFFVEVSQESTNKQEDDNGNELTIPQAFKQRFGKNWIEDKHARIMMYWLMIESGRNHESDSYVEMILNKATDETMDEVSRLGFDEEDF